MGAFRSVDGHEVLEAPTREGLLRLEVAPRHVTLTLGGVQVVVTDGFLTVTETVRTRVRRSSERIGGAIVVARAVPHEDLGLWMERDDEFRRVFGVGPQDLIAEGGLAALRALDRLGLRLRQALTEHARESRRALELGRGVDKVLVIEHEDRLTVYARRVFRDAARRVCEVHADGGVVLPERGGARFGVRDRFGVTVTGDYVRFIDPVGTDLGRVGLPWIAPEDRAELARRFGEMIERSLPPEQRALASALDAVTPPTIARGTRKRDLPGLRMLHRPRFRGR